MATIESKSGLALKVYAETLAAFERKNVFMDLVTKQTIKNGNTAQFIINGRGTESTIDTATGLPAGVAGAVGGEVQTHTLGGNQRDGASQMNITERTILTERPIYVRKQLDNYEEKMAHYNIRSMITGQNGSTMANFIDRRIVVEFNKAFSATNYPATATQYASGGIYNAAIGAGATAEAKGDAILESIFGAASILDGKDQIGSQRYFVTNNTNYYNLLMSQKAINRDFNAGDNGSIAKGNIFTIGDVMILRSNNLVGSLLGNLLGTSGLGQTLSGIMFTKDVIGLVEMMGLQTKEWFDDDYDQTVMKVQLAAGYGVLNPGSLVGITTGTAN